MWKGLGILARFLGKLFKGGFMFLGKYSKILPKSILGFFILLKFFSNLFTHGFNFAFEELAKSIFSAELVIRENVLLAIENSSNYGMIEFLEIFFSFMILWYLLKMLMKVFASLGMVSSFGQFLSAFLVIVVVESSAVVIINGKFNFIPIYDGVFFLMQNIEPVIQNIF